MRGIVYDHGAVAPIRRRYQQHAKRAVNWPRVFVPCARTKSKSAIPGNVGIGLANRKRRRTEVPLRCMREGYQLADKHFVKALVGLHSDDALAGFHLRRLLNGAKGVRMQLE